MKEQIIYLSNPEMISGNSIRFKLPPLNMDNPSVIGLEVLQCIIVFNGYIVRQGCLLKMVTPVLNYESVDDNSRRGVYIGFMKQWNKYVGPPDLNTNYKYLTQSPVKYMMSGNPDYLEFFFMSTTGAMGGSLRYVKMMIRITYE